MILLGLSFALVACSADSSIVGRWNEKSSDKFAIEFKADGTATASDLFEGLGDGLTYSLDNGQLSLMESASGIVHTYDVSQSGSTMTLTSVIGGQYMLKLAE